ncbi:hypothetical protein KSS87_023230 [Heliosperma pusillum]|nr:hypothetical protein KSS87_023230 [Heliosperma pusillum]
MEMNGNGQRETWNNTPSSSDLNHSSSSNSVSLSHSNSNSNSNQTRHNHHNQQQQQQHSQSDPMQSWWESVSKARSRIQTLLSLLPNLSSESLIDSDRPGRSLLESHAAYTALASSLTGSGDDPLCQWLYDTFQESESESESDLRLVVMSYVPLIAGMYLTRIHAVSTTTPTPVSPSLAGFEAVLLALYSSVTKSRSGKPVLVSIPTPAYLSHHSSLYHHHNPNLNPNVQPSIPSNSGIGVGVVCPPLEPQVGIKSTKRPFIIGLAFHSFYSHISQMPSWSKVQLCRFAASWAGDHCSCDLSLDIDNDDPDHDLAVSDSDSPLQLDNNEVAVVGVGVKEGGGLMPLPWEVLQPMLRILAHCLLAPSPLVSDDIREAANEAVRRLYSRASHDLSPQAILATRSLVHLHNHATAAATAAALAAAAATSNVTTPTSHKKTPEMLLVSQ